MILDICLHIEIQKYIPPYNDCQVVKENYMVCTLTFLQDYM